MKINDLSKFVVSLTLAVTTFSCSTNIPGNSNNTNNTLVEKSTTKGILSINLTKILNDSQKGFSVKRYKFSDNAVRKVKISVYSTDASGNASFDSNNMLVPEETKTVDRFTNYSDVTLSVSQGKNKVVTIETFDDKDVNLTVLMAAINIEGGKKTTLSINYGTYPTARILKTLMESSSASDRMLAYNLSLTDLSNFVNSLTGYDVNTNSYGGINPVYLDTDVIISKLKANNTSVPGVSVPFYKNDVKAYLFLNKSGLDLTANNGTLSNSSTASQTFTFTGRVAAGDIIYLNEYDPSNDTNSERSFKVVSVSGNTVTLDQAYTLATGKKITEISFPDRNKYDYEAKGKLRVTVKNSAGTILKGVKIEINDLTSENITSTSDDTTIIENVSMGKWLMRLTAYDSGKTLYLEQYVNINYGNLDQSITLVPSVAGVASIDFDAPDNDENIPFPSLIELNKGYSTSIKAHVTMVDHTENQNITWTSSDTNIVTVGSNGSINAVGDGTATVKAAATDDLTKFKTVTVKVSTNNNDGPVINSFTPTFASANTLVTIKGNNFDNTSLAATTVKFNNVSATVTDVTKTEIKAIVPLGASTGMIAVTTSKGTAISRDYFAINSPTGTNSSNVNTDGMVYIPGTATANIPNDTFYMGRDGNDTDDFGPRHKVFLKGYYIDKTEVTNSQFDAFIQAGGYTTDSYWSSEGLAFRNDNGLNTSTARPSYWNDARFNQPNQPVVGISWYEAEAYANWLGRRLPTEAEWEYAARGKDERAYPWGSDSPSEYNKKANGYFGGVLGNGDGYQYTNEVGKFSDGDSYFGLKDMAGNAYEWVRDNYDSRYYRNSPVDNPQGPSVGGSKVLRGGSWYNHPYYSNDQSKLANSLMSYSRFYSAPVNRSNYIGFRTAASK